MIFFLVIGNLSLFARKNVQLTSPNGKLKFSLTLEREHPVYDIQYQKQALVQNSPLSLVFDNGAFGEGLKMNKPVFSTKEETYELIVGKSKTVHSLSMEVVIPLEETAAPFRMWLVHLMTVSLSVMNFQSNRIGNRMLCTMRIRHLT